MIYRCKYYTLLFQSSITIERIELVRKKRIFLREESEREKKPGSMYNQRHLSNFPTEFESETDRGFGSKPRHLQYTFHYSHKKKTLKVFFSRLQHDHNRRNWKFRFFTRSCKRSAVSSRRIYEEERHRRSLDSCSTPRCPTSRCCRCWAGTPREPRSRPAAARSRSSFCSSRPRATRSGVVEEARAASSRIPGSNSIARKPRRILTRGTRSTRVERAILVRPSSGGINWDRRGTCRTSHRSTSFRAGRGISTTSPSRSSIYRRSSSAFSSFPVPPRSLSTAPSSSFYPRCSNTPCSRPSDVSRNSLWSQCPLLCSRRWVSTDTSWTRANSSSTRPTISFPPRNILAGYSCGRGFSSNCSRIFSPRRGGDASSSCLDLRTI